MYIKDILDLFRGERTVVIDYLSNEGFGHNATIDFQSKRLSLSCTNHIDIELFPNHKAVLKMKPDCIWVDVGGVYLHSLHSLGLQTRFLSEVRELIRGELHIGSGKFIPLYNGMEFDVKDYGSNDLKLIYDPVGMQLPIPALSKKRNKKNLQRLIEINKRMVAYQEIMVKSGHQLDRDLAIVLLRTAWWNYRYRVIQEYLQEHPEIEELYPYINKHNTRVVDDTSKFTAMLNQLEKPEDVIDFTQELYHPYNHSGIGHCISYSTNMIFINSIFELLFKYEWETIGNECNTYTHMLLPLAQLLMNPIQIKTKYVDA